MGRFWCSGLAKMDCGPSDRRVELLMVEGAEERIEAEAERMEAADDLMEPPEWVEPLEADVEVVRLSGGGGGRRLDSEEGKGVLEVER